MRGRKVYEPPRFMTVACRQVAQFLSLAEDDVQPFQPAEFAGPASTVERIDLVHIGRSMNSRKRWYQCWRAARK